MLGFHEKLEPISETGCNIFSFFSRRVLKSWIYLELRSDEETVMWLLISWTQLSYHFETDELHCRNSNIIEFSWSRNTSQFFHHSTVPNASVSSNLFVRTEQNKYVAAWLIIDCCFSWKSSFAKWTRKYETYKQSLHVEFLTASYWIYLLRRSSKIVEASDQTFLREIQWLNYAVNVILVHLTT